MLDEFTKKVLKQLLGTIIYIAIFLSILSVTAKKGVMTVCFIMFFMMLFKDSWSVIVKNSKKYLIGFATIYIMVSLMMYSLKYGIIGFILMVLILAAYKMFKGRSTMMEGMRNIETKIFGKSLDKEEWKNDKE